jgi:hypothetical protein
MTIRAGTYLTLAVAGLLISTQAGAACTCACVNGEMQPICQSSMDLPPICPTQLCPLVPPKIEPITPPRLPPLGTDHCSPHQVYDPESGQYVWKELCE